MKFRPSAPAVGLWALAMLALPPAPYRETPRQLKPDSTLPALGGQALTGKWLDLPRATGDGPAAVILSFNRTGGRDAQSWVQHLSKDYPHLAIFTVIFLESVPRLFRPMAVSSIRTGMPVSMQDRTIVVYRDEDLWKDRLHLTNENQAGVILLGPTGQIQCVTLGPFANSLYESLRKQIRASN